MPKAALKRIKDGLPPAPEHMQALLPLKVLVIGDNRCWGKADMLGEALVYAQRPKVYNAYIVHADTTVDPVNGALQSPFGYRPKLIASIIPKRAQRHA